MLRVICVLLLSTQCFALSAGCFAPSSGLRRLALSHARSQQTAVMQLDDLVAKLPLDKVPAPAQPWTKAYSGKPSIFLGDFVAILLYSGLNPLKAFPYWLVFFGAAQPLGAYSDASTSKYISGEFAAVWLASTLAGVILEAPFAGTLNNGLGGVVGKLIVTFIVLIGPRAFQTFQTTGEAPSLDSLSLSLPDLKAPDLDGALENNPFKNLEKNFGWDQDNSKPPPPDDSTRPPPGTA